MGPCDTFSSVFIYARFLFCWILPHYSKVGPKLYVVFVSAYHAPNGRSLQWLNLSLLPFIVISNSMCEARGCDGSLNLVRSNAHLLSSSMPRTKPLPTYILPPAPTEPLLTYCLPLVPPEIPLTRCPFPLPSLLYRPISFLPPPQPTKPCQLVSPFAPKNL